MTECVAAPDLLVVGGGVIGLASAREAAHRGLRVTIFDRGVPGRGSTWAAAGMLSPLSEAGDSGPFLRFGLDSLAMYRKWAQSLVAETNLTFGFRKGEKLHLAASDAESRILEDRRSRATKSGISVEWLTAEMLRTREPTLGPSFLAGLLIHDDYRLDNRRLVEALIEGCERAGVEVHSETPVESIRIEGGRANGWMEARCSWPRALGRVRYRGSQGPSGSSPSGARCSHLPPKGRFPTGSWSRRASIWFLGRAGSFWWGPLSRK